MELIDGTALLHANAAATSWKFFWRCPVKIDNRSRCVKLGTTNSQKVFTGANVAYWSCNCSIWYYVDWAIQENNRTPDIELKAIPVLRSRGQNCKEQKLLAGSQCFGSGSGWIRIRNPDSGSGRLKIGIKSQNLLRVIVFVTLWRWEQKSALIGTVQELFILGNIFLSRTVKKLARKKFHSILTWSGSGIQDPDPD